LCISSISLPNFYRYFLIETEQLTGIKVKSIDDARKACEILHQMGPSIVFITSAILLQEEDEDVEDNNNKQNQQQISQNLTTDTDDDSNKKTITIIASKRCSDADEGKEENQTMMWRIDCPLIPGSFTGTGDVTASLLLGHLEHHPNDLPLVMEKVINTMYVLIRRTHEAKKNTVRSKELRLIPSKDIIENPPSTFKAAQIVLGK
jgi:pyridoxal/pyridoxine/pyridoxamine kinase